MGSNPLVSVYIISYNRPEYLDRAIQSVFAQTYKNLEIIVVDDCSVKNTCSVFNKYIGHQNFKIYINKENMGACYSRNVAINAASGYFITGLDDDDYFAEERIEDFLNNYSDNYSFLCSSYNTTRFINTPVVFDHSYLLFDNVAGNQFFCKTQFARSILFDVTLKSSQDLDFMYRLSKSYGVFRKLPSKTYNIDTSCGDRISISRNKLVGLKQFNAKHFADMSIRQKLYWFFLIKKWGSGNKVYRNSIDFILLMLNIKKLVIR